MNRFLLITVFILICYRIGFAQNNSDTTMRATVRGYNISVDLFRLSQSSLQINYEKALTQTTSLEIGAIGTWATAGGVAKFYLKAQDFSYKDATTGELKQIDRSELKGYGFNIKYKFYLGKPAIVLKEWWVAPEFFYRNLNVDGKYTSLNQEKEAHKKLYLAYLGYALGYQKTLFEAICIDTYIGGGFFYSQYKGESFKTTKTKNYQLDYTGFYVNASIAIGLVK